MKIPKQDSDSPKIGGKGLFAPPIAGGGEGPRRRIPLSTKTFYLTTPIYYVNGVPHVGTATTTLIADAVVRFQRLRGRDAYLLTGTDEHAQKVADAAAKAGQSPQEFVDDISQRFVQAWQFLNVQYDEFIRTSDPRHKRVVEEVFRRLQEQGDVYTGLYEGWYSVADETFYRDTDVENGVAKESGARVERVTEENYYFRLSAYGDRLLAYIEQHPDFLMPETRRNEVISFIKEGLRDVPVSRRNTGWGIPVPGDPSQVVYVWFDALINYLTSTGWPEDPDYTNRWPADAHLVGKEIYTRFHATLWPAMLMGLGLPLPTHVVGHGWWLISGEKGSKSKGNIPTPQQTVEWIVNASNAAQEIAVDALRYYLLRDISFSGDAEFCTFTEDDGFKYENLTTRYNSELANNIGNLLNRSLNMLQQYEEGVVPDAAARQAGSTVALAAEEVARLVETHMDDYNPGGALEAIARFADVVNKQIGLAEPWKRHKEGNREAVADALYTALEANRILSVLLAPFLPATAAAMRSQLGITQAPAHWREASTWGLLAVGTQTPPAAPLFPRIETKRAGKSNAPVKEKPSVTEPSAVPAPATTAAKPEAPAAPVAEMIGIEDFMKVQLRVAQIIKAEPIAGAKKLLKLTLDDGTPEGRQIASGIAEYYTPEELTGRKIIVVANLQPREMRGVVSQGMLLAATDATGRAILLQPDNPDTPPGALVR